MARAASAAEITVKLPEGKPYLAHANATANENLNEGKMLGWVSRFKTGGFAITYAVDRSFMTIERSITD
jgi:hypothetical protein